MRPAFSEQPSRPVQRELIAANDNLLVAEKPEPVTQLYARTIAFLYAGAFLFFVGLFLLLQ